MKQLQKEEFWSLLKNNICLLGRKLTWEDYTSGSVLKDFYTEPSTYGKNSLSSNLMKHGMITKSMFSLSILWEEHNKVVCAPRACWAGCCRPSKESGTSWYGSCLPSSKHGEDLHVYDVDLWCRWFGHFEDFAIKKFSTSRF